MCAARSPCCGRQAGARAGRDDIDAVAYTTGPGLPGALMVGACLGRALGMALDASTLGVHYLEAHLLAPMMAGDAPAPPFVLLLASGGHTQLSGQQRRRVKRLFKEFQERTFLPANETYRDEVRQALDQAFLVDLLGLPKTILESLNLLRRKWCAEPTVHGGKKTRIQEND